MSQRARQALRALDQILDGTQLGMAAPVPGRPNVTLEIPMDKAGHIRASSADDEIIETKRVAAQITGTEITVATADTAMRLRTQSTGLKAP